MFREHDAFDAAGVANLFAGDNRLFAQKVAGFTDGASVLNEIAAFFVRRLKKAAFNDVMRLEDMAAESGFFLN